MHRSDEKDEITKPLFASLNFCNTANFLYFWRMVSAPKSTDTILLLFPNILHKHPERPSFAVSLKEY